MSEKVLIVSLMKSNVVLLMDSLKYEGFKVEVTCDTEDILNIVCSFAPDIILIDIMTPLINGFDICKIIKSNIKSIDIPVIIFSAQNDSYVIKRSFEAGACDFIKEPFNDGEVILRINKAIKDNSNLKAFTLSQRQNNVYDLLEGIYTKQIFDHFLEKEIKENLRNGQELSFLIIDVDAGRKAEYIDAYMRDIGSLVISSLREYDIVSKHDINKYGVLLKGADSHELNVICTRLLSNMEKTMEKYNIRPKINIAAYSNCVNDSINSEVIYSYTESALNKNPGDVCKIYCLT